MKIFHQKGFTLVELLIVIAVIGVLATSLTFFLNPLTQIQKARDANRKSHLKQIQNAFELYYQDNKMYPPDQSMYYTSIDGKYYGQAWTPYMQQLPHDPSANAVGVADPNRHYQYIRLLGGQGYCLYANLERADDPQACGGGQCPNVINPPMHCGQDAAHRCNYGVCSPNASP